MLNKHKIGLLLILTAAAATWVFALSKIPLPWTNWTFALLEPKGIIAQKEYKLMLNAVLLMLVAVIPAYLLVFYFVKKNITKNSEPGKTLDNHNRKLTFLIWAIPCAVIFTIAGIIWVSTHELDPYKPLESNVKPLTIEVVALRWKWLFIYPKQNIASVNFIQIPKDTPVVFKLTADGPMNTFWIPQLSGQIYTMAAMETKLHILATETGEFVGRTSEINGDGFSGMNFITKVSDEQEFNNWVGQQKTQNRILDQTAYSLLLEPSENNPPEFFGSIDPNLYQSIIMKYMAPQSIMHENETAPKMDMAH